MVKAKVFCDECDQPLNHLSLDPAQRPPCPKCGSTERRVGEDPADSVTVGDSVGGSQTRVREWVETNWPALLGGAVLSVAGFLLAGWIGLLAGVGASVVSVEAFTTVREREVDRF